MLLFHPTFSISIHTLAGEEVHFTDLPCVLPLQRLSTANFSQRLVLPPGQPLLESPPSLCYALVAVAAVGPGTLALMAEAVEVWVGRIISLSSLGKPIHCRLEPEELGEFQEVMALLVRIATLLATRLSLDTPDKGPQALRVKEVASLAMAEVSGVAALPIPEEEVVVVVGLEGIQVLVVME